MDHDPEQDVEDLARRLFALDTKGVDSWGLAFLAPGRPNFLVPWDDVGDATKHLYRQQARQIISDRKQRR